MSYQICKLVNLVSLHPPRVGSFGERGVASGYLFTPRLSWGSYVGGLAASRLCRRGTCPGWPAGTRLPAPRLLRSTGPPCGRGWAKGAHPASARRGAAAPCWWTPGGAATCLGRCSGQGRGLVLSALVWSGWGSHMDPSWGGKEVTLSKTC